MSVRTQSLSTYLTALLRRFACSTEGATSIEYAFIAAGIGIAIVVSIDELGVALNDEYVSFAALF